VSIAVRVGVATIIVLAGAFTLASAGEPSTNLIPLKEGNTWQYEGHARWTTTTVAGADHTNHLHNAEVRWTARVTKSISAKGVHAAVVSGFPLAFSMDDPEHQPGYAVVVETKKGLFVQAVESERAGEVVAVQSLSSQNQDDQILRLPIRVGDCIGESQRRPLRSTAGWYASASKNRKVPDGIFSFILCPTNKTFTWCLVWE